MINIQNNNALHGYGCEESKRLINCCFSTIKMTVILHGVKQNVVDTFFGVCMQIYLLLFFYLLQLFIDLQKWNKPKKKRSIYKTFTILYMELYLLVLNERENCVRDGKSIWEKDNEKRTESPTLGGSTYFCNKIQTGIPLELIWPKAFPLVQGDLFANSNISTIAKVTCRFQKIWIF